MKWIKKGMFSNKMVSEDGNWEIYDTEFGHAAVRKVGTNRGFFLTASSASSAKAIKEAEDRIKQAD